MTRVVATGRNGRNIGTVRLVKRPTRGPFKFYVANSLWFAD